MYLPLRRLNRWRKHEEEAGFPVDLPLQVSCGSTTWSSSATSNTDNDLGKLRSLASFLSRLDVHFPSYLKVSCAEKSPSTPLDPTTLLQPMLSH